MRGIKQIKNIKGKNILLRVDFNVPIKNGKVEDDFRIQKALPTIKFLQKKGAKLILITHLGDGRESLLPVSRILNKFVKTTFISETIGPIATKAINGMTNGEVVMLENLRKNKGEQKCSKVFAIELAKLADIYVNEAFPVDHRSDASIVLLPKLLPAYAGLQLENEVKNLSKAFKNPQHPFLFILGGAKFSTKMPLIKKYLKLADKVFIGGALANDFLKAEGYVIGKSLVDDTNYDIKKILKNKKLVLPVDVVVKSGNKFINKKIDEIKQDEIILDMGTATVKELALLVNKSKLVLFNGPLGKYENGGAGATKKILKAIGKSKTKSIIGGGDTVTMISEMKIEKEFSFVSTGGGATLDFLADGSLPGIKALQ
ncbi:MAG: phosphoglycerate kinase [Patescibacteria group bacterium]|nr:phosphoglycerate kinase [Patescibacteria group bacterium]